MEYSFLEMWHGNKKKSWAHLSVHYIDAVNISGNVLNIFSGYEGKLK